MKKRMTIMVIALVIVFGAIFGWGMVKNYYTRKFLANYKPPPATVSAAKVVETAWNPTLKAVGTLTAVYGVNVSSQTTGMINKILFNSGQLVKKGQVLIQLDDAVDQRDLQNFEAQLQVAKLKYDRYLKLKGTQALSQEAIDEAQSAYMQAKAQVAKAQALINQKTIRAPFDGKIGIRQVNLGQYIQPGANVASLQSLDPLLVQFSLPEQDLNVVKVGQPIQVKVDSSPGKVYPGVVSAINSEVDQQTRSILIQARVPNPRYALYPGSFANLSVVLPQQQHVLIVPQTAVNYSLYGDSVYVIEASKTNPHVKQQLVKTGDKINNNIVILEGLRAGDLIVTSGQMKLHNGARVVISNDVVFNQLKAVG